MTGLVLAILFALAWVPLFAYRTEMIQQAMPFYSADERRWIRLTPTIVAIHATLSCIVVSLTEPPAWRIVLSVAVLTGGVVFWFWARAQIGPLRVTRMPDEPPHVLRRDGAFGLVRNPLYFGYLVASAAPLIVAPRPLLIVTFAACFVALSIRAEQDERRLHRQLGTTYAEYCRTVKRLIPFVW